MHRSARPAAPQKGAFQGTDHGFLQHGVQKPAAQNGEEVGVLRLAQ